jgi:hypothetical protein
MSVRSAQVRLVSLGLTALVACLTVGGACRAQPFFNVLKGEESEALKETYIILASTNRDYGGHRVRALRSVERAINFLDVDLLQQGSATDMIQLLQGDQAMAVAQFLSQNSGGINEDQIISDAQLRVAHASLGRIAGVLTANQQMVPLAHIKNAGREIQTALMTSQVLSDAQQLKEAYVLLAAGNKDYNGHRDKAMREVEHAIKLLDARLMKQGGLQQKIQALRDNQVAMAAKLADQASAPVKGSQGSSDVLMLYSGYLIKAVALSPAVNRQPTIMKHVNNASGEIARILKTR